MSDASPYKTGQEVTWINERGETRTLRYVAGLWSTPLGLLYDEIQLNDIGWNIAHSK